MSDDRSENPTPKRDPSQQSYHEWKIEQLEKQRRPPSPMPALKPPGSPPHKQLTKEDKKYNEALDRQIQLWHDQAEKTQGMDGQSKEAFSKEIAKGKIKGKAKDRFNRASGIER